MNISRAERLIPMKQQFKKFLVTSLIAAMAVSNVSALACTGAYVGKAVSQDGSIIIARSEDISAAYDKLQTVVPASDEPGRMMKDINGFSYPLPDHTYQYTQMEDYSTAGDGLYAAVCVNELGVAITGTVSASGCAEYKAVDPTVKTGLREAVLPALAAATAATAREAVKVLTEAVDEYGSAEGNVILVADQEEAWILEIYGGKQYAAMRLADDQVAVFGNHFMLGAIDPEDTESFVVSQGLLSTLEAAGLTVTDDSGKVLAAQSVCGGQRSAGNNLRNWGGMHILAPSLAGETFDVDTFYPLLYTPDEKVSLEDVFEVFRCRYEDTAYDLSLEGQEGNRAIAVSGTPETHVVQIYGDMPAKYSAVTWLALAGGEHSLFLPQFSGVSQLPQALGMDAPTYQADSAYWAFKRICGLADTDRALYTSGVQSFWKLQEASLVSQMAEAKAQLKTLAETDPAAAEAYVNTKLEQDMADALTKSDVLYGELLTLVCRNSGTSASRAKAFQPSVPLRTVAEAKGYTVTWDDEAKAVILTKDGASQTVDIAAGDGFLVNGVTYVPFSFVEEL